MKLTYVVFAIVLGCFVAYKNAQADTKPPAWFSTTGIFEDYSFMPDTLIKSVGYRIGTHGTHVDKFYNSPLSHHRHILSIHQDTRPGHQKNAIVLRVIGGEFEDNSFYFFGEDSDCVLSFNGKFPPHYLVLLNLGNHVILCQKATHVLY